MPAQHYWSHYKNSNIRWIGTDSELNFIENCKDPKKYQQLQKYRFDQPEAVSYQFNSHGFRCNEFDSSPAFVALGCSFTSGVGLPLHQTWPALVANQVNLSCWNLAVGAGTMDTCMRLLHYYIDEFDIKFVMLLRPSETRFEVFQDGRVLNVLPAKIELDFQKIWYSNQTNSEMNFLKNTMAIQHICQQRKLKLIIKDLGTDLFGKPYQDAYPGARDLKHAGASQQQFCAENFLQSL